jgi:hypothetical protein
MSSTEITLTTEPPAESRTVAECQVTVDRMAAPMEEAMNCPITAKLTSSTTAMTSCWVCPGDARAELRAEQRAADEPEEAQDADDEALPVTGHGEGSDHDEQDQVEHISAHDLNRIAFSALRGPPPRVTSR